MLIVATPWPVTQHLRTYRKIRNSFAYKVCVLLWLTLAAIVSNPGSFVMVVTAVRTEDNFPGFDLGAPLIVRSVLSVTDRTYHKAGNTISS